LFFSAFLLLLLFVFLQSAEDARETKTRGRVNQRANPNVLSKISDGEKEIRIRRADDDVDAPTFFTLSYSLFRALSFPLLLLLLL
jgi:hypothetical protein